MLTVNHTQLGRGLILSKRPEFLVGNRWYLPLCTVTGISDSKVTICVGNSGSNRERTPCRQIYWL